MTFRRRNMENVSLKNIVRFRRLQSGTDIQSIYPDLKLDSKDFRFEN